MKTKKIIFLIILFLVITTARHHEVFAQEKLVSENILLEVSLKEADTKHPQIFPMLGVVSGPSAAQGSGGIDLTQHLKDIGVVSIKNENYFDDRLNIEQILQIPNKTTYPSWEGGDASKPENYSWKSSDLQFENIINNGFEIFLRLGTEKENRLRQHEFKGPQNAEMEKNWIIAAENMIRRYEQWKGTKRLRFVELWSGFPDEKVWDRSPADFYKFWAKALELLKQMHPALLFGGPGFSNKATQDMVAGQGGEVKDFLDYLYWKKTKPDWLSWQIFSNDPLYVYKAAETMSAALRGEGSFQGSSWGKTDFFKDTKILIDSFGLDQQENAAILTAHWIALQHQQIQGAWVYQAARPVGENYKAEQGLFVSNGVGSYTGQAHAFRLWARLAKKYPYKIKTQPYYQVAEDQNIWILAGSKQANNWDRVGVLLSNPTTKEQALKLSIANKKTAQASGFLVNTTSKGRGSQAVDLNKIILPPSSVLFVDVRY